MVECLQRREIIRRKCPPKTVSPPEYEDFNRKNTDNVIKQESFVTRTKFNTMFTRF